MLNQHRKCETVMDTDNSSSFGGYCPSKAKKSKTSLRETAYKLQNISPSQWNYLPAVLLHEIFDLLNKDDRRNAASVCKHWRQNSFHPKWWPSMTFKIEESNLKKANFYTNVFGTIVSEATIKLNSLSQNCMEEFIVLLEALAENNNLRELIIEPTHCRFEIPTKRIEIRGENEIMNLLRPCLARLHKFSIGCIEDLSSMLEELLKGLTPSKVTHLGLASVKDDPSFYQVSRFDPDCLIPFKKLKVLTIDYDHLCDNLLNNLHSATELERLVVHLHGVSKSHPGTTDRAWRAFHQTHPNCEFRLTVIHAFKDIKFLDEVVLRTQMPLTHLKVFFCESINMRVLDYLSKHYHHTLRSVMWIDSYSKNMSSWVFAESSNDNPEIPDPFVVLAWLCKNLEELVLYGYKYMEENLVAIGRLRGEELKKLEIVEEDILFFNNPKSNEDALVDIPKSMKRPWAPVKLSDLHPVICNPNAGDSDEYLLPIVLADLH